MYQTVGHSLIPLYARALDLPLYRQEILGRAVNTERDYTSPDPNISAHGEEENDETESLVPLLKKVMAAHPDANAVSTGAILSTYQRTRVENVALRLGLTPLSFLWQYPVLPPYTQAGLLRDMEDVGMDARIIKVASGGLDAGFLWENVADSKTVTRLQRAMARFGENGDGAVLGEGGEFETLAVDGPGVLWKGRIEVLKEGDGVSVGEGGNAVFRGRDARVVMKEGVEGQGDGLEKLRIPDLWDDEFKKVLEKVSSLDLHSTNPRSSLSENPLPPTPTTLPTLLISSTPTTLTLSNLVPSPGLTTPTSQITSILSTLTSHLSTHNLTPAHILHVTILLRHISDFKTINAPYASYFNHSNPPTRVTISNGPRMPPGTDILLSVIASKHLQPGMRKGLHVQSRSYWAPANIGPYSQAITAPLLPDTNVSLAGEEQEEVSASETRDVQIVYLAGQIPLEPARMQLRQPSSSSSSSSGYVFASQATLALQHLFRVSRAVRVRWFTVGIAFLGRCPDDKEAARRASIVRSVWKETCTRTLGPETDVSDGEANNDDDESDENSAIDPWDLRNRISALQVDDTTHRAPVLDPTVLDRLPFTPTNSSQSWKPRRLPPVFSIEVQELPAGADIEWHSTGLSGSDLTGALTLVSSLLEKSTLTYLPKEKTVVVTMEIDGEGDGVEDVPARLEEMTDLLGLSREEKGFCWDHAVLYAGHGLEGRAGGHWDDCVEGLQWVPCFRVWGEGGEKVGGVVVLRGTVVP
ncbi:adenine nucleotide alpha hydrolases-like protein [Sporormia fimetaria CBS 119925]|uniref:Diphthine--ammonia ligase n=1 Tax=Sporormia fimetaria CBS 119925 TaxID=1340428 RepID=A0A6A6VH75_9PLEO|nr:adenine nucleotide alpha hydrolases-like protein [Sporormia fimetaria CBS 119925]